jgi:hypothetical protein
MPHPQSIAIIGAGIAGLSASKTLAESGHTVTLFDKSRGLGGRMATKRVGDLTFDHGAQYFTAHTDHFKEILESAIKAGFAAKWELNRYVGVPGMSSFARFLAGQRDVRFDTAVEALTRTSNHWSLRDIHGKHYDGFDAVILSLPSPQISAILKNSNIELEGIDQIHYSPCWALMLAFDEAVDFLEQALSSDDPVIAWIAKNSSKPTRTSTSETFVVHATPQWSADHIELDADIIAKMLLSRFSELMQIKANPSIILAHRWRYARVTKPLGRPFLWDKNINLGACGDWAMGSRIEDAFNSGNMLARACFNED